MKFVLRFDISNASLWTCLLIVVLLVSTPFYASQASSIGGEITAIDIAERTIEMGGKRYKLVPQIEIKNMSSETEQTMKITDLQVGQYVEFEDSGGLIQSLRVFDVPHT